MQKVFIIAEAGVNHNGKSELAYKLIDVAVSAGANAVKFQTFKSDHLASRYAHKAKYQSENDNKNCTQLEMLKRLELHFEEFKKLRDYCTQCGIIFMSTPFDIESIDYLYGIGMDIFKISSGDITNLPYLKRINALQKKVILSTGMSNLEDIGNALNILSDCSEISLLHCTTSYPTPFDSVNLNAMQAIKNAFNLPVGYSDHTEGLEVSIAAVALGAVIIEKHFTLDKNMEGPDHKASLNPIELSELVKAIRNVEDAMGTGVKSIAPAEYANISSARKSIVAKEAIKKGEVFMESNITTKRPGTGITPMYWEMILGKIAKRDYNIDEMIIDE